MSSGRIELSQLKGRQKLNKSTKLEEDDIYEEVADDKKTLYVRDVKRLRRLLKIYFHTAIKWQGNTLSIHWVYCCIMLIQFIKVVLITSQMFDFGHDRGNFSDVIYRGHLTLRHLLLRNWDASWETLNYPPAHGDFALYTSDDVENAINHAVTRYYNAHKEAMGYYLRTKEDKMVLKIKYFDFPGFQDARVREGFTVREIAIPIDKGMSETHQPDGVRYHYNVSKELKSLNITEPFQRMLSAVLHFNIHSVRVYEKAERGRCLRIEGWVVFKDPENNGQVGFDLETLTRRILCHTINITVPDMSLENTDDKLGRALVAFCLLSIIATALNVIFAGYVFLNTKRFMKEHYKQHYNPSDPAEKDLPVDEYLRFIRPWDMVVFVSDCLTLYGTVEVIFKTEYNEWLQDTLDAYTVWLGLGCTLAWICLLRFFQFNYKFHLLFSTLYRAFWDVIAYLFCISVLFLGYWACGYVVLGPYHVKFRTPGSAAETLLSIISGDEIYVTLAILEEDRTSPEVLWFSRLFIGSYVAVFTIVVINLLVAIFMSAYDSIKEFYDTKPEERGLGPMEKALRRYLEEQQESKALPVQSVLRTSIYDLLSNKGTLTTGENTLRRELEKLFGFCDKKKDLVVLKARTLKAFMSDDEDDETNVVNLGCFNLSILRISRDML